MGTLFVVATPIGNLSDMTFRAIETLKAVKYIAAEDTRHLIPLLKRYDISGRKLVSLHKFNESKKSSGILDKIESEDCDIALVSDAGTPCISDPGGVLVKAARERNISVIGIPGATAMALAVSISGLDVDRFAFLGFFPKENKQIKSLIALMQAADIKTFVIYESPLRILHTLNYLSKVFPNSFGMVGNDLTKMFESSVYGTLGDIISVLEDNENVEKGEYVIVIEPRFVPKEIEDDISLEALLVNEMVLHGLTLKDAVRSLSVKMDFGKNEVYKASLRVKELIRNSEFGIRN
jgi:16S rRNA (cytidine1402-2'-O)-methyltransferase